MKNIEQAKALLDAANERKLIIPKHECTDECAPLGCYRPLLFGTINPPTFTGKDIMWGTKAAGSLIGNWDYRSGRLVSLEGHFPGPEGRIITESYSELL